MSVVLVTQEILSNNDVWWNYSWTFYFNVHSTAGCCLTGCPDLPVLSTCDACRGSESHDLP